MNLITAMEARSIGNIKENWHVHFAVEETIIRKHFDWLKLQRSEKVLTGNGCVVVDGVKYCIELVYSPFFPFRMDRIRLTNHRLEYHDDIHVYGDLSLCLYHPFADKPYNKIVPLHRMIPWISEWCHFYGQWKKYNVWLGKEIKH